MFKNSKEYMPTYALIAANVAVYAFTCILSGNIVKTSDKVITDFGQDNYAILNGDVWRFFTAMFIHANITHIFGNMLFLLIFGLRAEGMFDVKEYLLIYFLSGLSGGFLTLALWHDALSVGASGAVFGVLGATIIYARRAIGQSIMTALLYAFFLFYISSFGSANINYLSHLGGLVAGLLIGYALAASRRSKPAVTYEHNYPASWGR